MAGPQFRPIDGDPGAEAIATFFDATSEEWLLTDEGDYATAAAETFRRDGSGYQPVVILRWPARVNHSTERRVVQLMISPEDAMGLADVLAHTAGWMLARGA